MDGNYPGCWQAFNPDHDQDKGEDPNLKIGEGQISDERDSGEETTRDRLFSKTSKPEEEMGEKIAQASNLALVICTRLLKGAGVKERKSMIPRPISALPSAASSRKEGRSEEKRERHETCEIYVPTGAPKDSDIFPKRTGLEPHKTEKDACGWYDELGFLTDEPRLEDRFAAMRTQIQLLKERLKQPARPPQQVERYVGFVAEMSVSLNPPSPLQNIDRATARQSPLSDLVVEGGSLPPARRASPLFLRSGPKETRAKSPAPILGDKVGSDDGPIGFQPSMLESNNLHSLRQRPPRPDGFVPFLEFVQEPGRFLRNTEKLRRQKERRQALYESTRAARNQIQDGVASSSRGKNVADYRAKVQVERSVTLFSWESGMTNRFETSRADAIDSAGIRRCEIARERSVPRSRSDVLYLFAAQKSDSTSEAAHQEVAEQMCSSQRAEPLKPSRNAWWEPNIHSHVLEAVEGQLDEHLSEDLWSFIEGDDRDFTVVQQRQGMIHELPEQWRQRASDHNLVPLNHYGYVQYDAQILYDPTQWPEGRETDADQNYLFPDRCPSCLSWRSVQNCSLCWTIHTQESVIDPSYPPMRVWDAVRVEGNEDEKRLPGEISSQMAMKKSVCCWPFSCVRRGIEPKKDAASTGDAGKGLWKRKAERRKLSKIPPTPKDWRKND